MRPPQVDLDHTDIDHNLFSAWNFTVSFHDDATGHAVFSMIWDQTRIFECSCLRKLPKDFGCLFWRYPHAVRIVMRHVWMLLHNLRVLHVLLCSSEKEFVILGADVAEHEAYLLATFDLDFVWVEGHLAHRDLNRAREIGRASCRGRVSISVVA